MAHTRRLLLLLSLSLSLLFETFAATLASRTLRQPPTFALKVNAPGTEFHDLYLDKSPPSTSPFGFATLIKKIRPAICLNFNLKNYQLLLDHQYFGTIRSSDSLTDLILFSPVFSPRSIWRLSLGDHGVLSCDGNPFFYVCGEPDHTTPKVGLGNAPRGCTPITFDSVDSCRADLPHLEARNSKITYFPNFLVPVKSQSPDTAYGSVYAPQIIKHTRLEVGFDVRYGGATCELWFLLPGTHDNPGPGGAPYTVSPAANFTAQLLSGPVSTSTTFNNRPAPLGPKYNFQLFEGQSVHIATIPCAQGQQQAFELSAVDDASIDWFETASPAVGIVFIQY